jgi:hypothetical protein
MWKKSITNDGVAQPWGFSWHIKDVNGKQIIGHSGGWQGFTANFDRYPEKKLAVSAFTNLRGANPEAITREVMSIFAPELSIDCHSHDRRSRAADHRYRKRFFCQVRSERSSRQQCSPSPASEQIFPNRDRIAERWSTFGELQSLLNCLPAAKNKRAFATIDIA